MKIFKNKILISFFVIVFLLLSSVGIYYFFSYDPNIYLDYGNENTIFSFKYPSSLKITSDGIPTLLEAYPKDYRPYPVFQISIIDISEREKFSFSKEYFDSWLNGNGKILDFKKIKIENKIGYYYLVERDGKKIRNIVTLPNTSFGDEDIVLNNNFLVGISYYDFDEKKDEKIFNVLIKTLKENNLVSRIIYYEIESKLKQITDSVKDSNNKPLITKQWYFEAEKTFNYWKEKNILSQGDIDKIQKIIDGYRIYLN